MKIASKFLSFIIAVILFLSSTLITKADMLNIDDVIESYNNIRDNVEHNVRIAKNVSENKLEYYLSDEKIGYVNYDNNKIWYVEENSFDADHLSRVLPTIMSVFNSTLDSIVVTSGNENKRVRQLDPLLLYGDDFYNEYGVAYNMYVYLDEDEDSHPVSFQISLDSDKINTLVSEYGENYNYNNNNDTLWDIFGNNESSYIDIEDLVDIYNNLQYNKDRDIKIIIDRNNHQLKYYKGSELFSTVNYNNESLSYSKTLESSDDSESITVLLNMMKVFYSTLDSLIKASGYENMTISQDFEYNDNTYEEYGIYGNTVMDEDSETLQQISFRLSLDKTKIDKLVEDYGEKYENDGENDFNPWDLFDFFEGLVGISEEIDNVEIELLFKNITGDSITIETKLNPNIEGLDCILYRADSFNGEYTVVSEGSCSVDSVDTNLKGDTTYYYKVKIGGTDKYSNVFSKATKIANEENKSKNNPTTGFITPKVPIIILLAIGIILLIIPKKDYLHRF